MMVIKKSHGGRMIINVIKVEGSAQKFGPVSPTGQVVELPVYSKGYFTHVSTIETLADRAAMRVLSGVL